MMSKHRKRSYMDLANRDLLRDIGQKYQSLVTVPGYHLKLRDGISSSLKYLADLSAWFNRDVALRKELTEELEITDRAKLKRLSQEGFFRVNNAWQYLRGAVDYSKKTTAELLTPNLVQMLAQLLNPDINQGYRKFNEKAESFKPDYNPPNSFQVPTLIEDFCKRLNGSNTHPVNRAAFAHLGLVSIQPFRSAHKRLGRLLQDSILCDADLPVATIYPGEKQIYYDLLRSAVIGFAKKDSLSQVPFYDYVAGKVNTRLDELTEAVLIQKSK